MGTKLEELLDVHRQRCDHCGDKIIGAIVVDGWRYSFCEAHFMKGLAAPLARWNSPAHSAHDPLNLLAGAYWPERAEVASVEALAQKIAKDELQQRLDALERARAPEPQPPTRTRLSLVPESE